MKLFVTEKKIADEMSAFVLKGSSVDRPAGLEVGAMASSAVFLEVPCSALMKAWVSSPTLVNRLRRQIKDDCSSLF